MGNKNNERINDVIIIVDELTFDNDKLKFLKRNNIHNLILDFEDLKTILSSLSWDSYRIKYLKHFSFHKKIKFSINYNDLSTLVQTLNHKSNFNKCCKILEKFIDTGSEIEPIDLETKRDDEILKYAELIENMSKTNLKLKQKQKMIVVFGFGLFYLSLIMLTVYIIYSF